MSFRFSLQIIEGSEASARVRAAQRWVEARADGGALIVSASRGAAADLARAVAAARGATIGWHRFSFAQLAARLAARVGDARPRAGTMIGVRGSLSAATFRCAASRKRRARARLLRGCCRTPGFPRALARTLQSLTIGRVQPGALTELPLGGKTCQLLDEFERQFAAASATGPASLFAAAAEGAGAVAHLPVLLLDVPLDRTSSSRWRSG